MPTPRNFVVAEGEIAAYHCIARCVRRAALCGKDPLTQRNFDHRKRWIFQRLQDLARAFAIDIGGFAIMSNHLHVVVKTRPDIAADWDADEITQRWRIALPVHRPPAVLKTLYEAEVSNKKLVASRRRRLSSISWFMRCLLELIARKSNKEDSCKGRFWEERFECIGLLDDSAILACTAYVDLNPIRAGICKTPEESEYTSVFARIKQRQQQKSISTAADNWLSPICSRDRIAKSSRRASQTAWLDMSVDEYLTLLDWTGRQLREGKKGAIPDELPPILDRLKINPAGWLLGVREFGRLFKRFAGDSKKLEARLRANKRKNLHGKSACEEVFR